MRNSVLTTLVAILGAILLAACSGGTAEAPTSIEKIAGAKTPATAAADPAWTEIPAIFGRSGVLRDDVYTIEIPRDDLDVRIEGVDVPPAAGVESSFWFYRCICGKMNVVGQFIVADYEANDVIDSLRAGRIKVATVSPALLYEKPRLMLIRFQGEGDAAALAKTIREAMRWTGKERMAPRKME